MGRTSLHREALGAADTHQEPTEGSAADPTGGSAETQIPPEDLRAGPRSPPGRRGQRGEPAAEESRSDKGGGWGAPVFPSHEGEAGGAAAYHGAEARSSRVSERGTSATLWKPHSCSETLCRPQPILVQTSRRPRPSEDRQRGVSSTRDGDGRGEHSHEAAGRARRTPRGRSALQGSICGRLARSSLWKDPYWAVPVPPALALLSFPPGRSVDRGGCG